MQMRQFLSNLWPPINKSNAMNLIIAKKRKNKVEMCRELLRKFTRTSPSFVICFRMFLLHMFYCIELWRVHSNAEGNILKIATNCVVVLDGNAVHLFWYAWRMWWNPIWLQTYRRSIIHIVEWFRIARVRLHFKTPTAIVIPNENIVFRKFSKCSAWK